MLAKVVLMCRAGGRAVTSHFRCPKEHGNRVCLGRCFWKFFSSIFFGLRCATCSVSHFAMLFRNVMTMIYKSLREVCTTSWPCTLWSNSWWSTLNSSSYFSPLTGGGGCKRNKSSSVPWCPLSQLKLTRSSWNTNEPSSVAWWPFSKLTHGDHKTNKLSRGARLPLIPLNYETYSGVLKCNKEILFSTQII